MPPLHHLNRGHEADYVLGVPLGWNAFDVVRWQAREELCQPFHYRIVLVRATEQGPIDLDALLGRGGTFCIAANSRWRWLHGILTEAELIDHTHRMLLYQVVLEPHLVRAAHRRRCRTFVDKSLREIVECALEARMSPGPANSAAGGLLRLQQAAAPPTGPPPTSPFAEPHGAYRWALRDPDRADVPRRHTVQYNESDLSFVARLLEAEGIGYCFEHTASACVMTLTDAPGHGPLFPRDEVHELVTTGVAGGARGQEVVRVFRQCRRMRPNAVTMRDYAWRKSLSRIEASASGGHPQDGLRHFEFPARDEDDPTAPAQAPARYQMERYLAEQSMCEGQGTVRTLEPGGRFLLRDRAALRADQELCVVGVEAQAVQLLPESTPLDSEPAGRPGQSTPTHAFFDCSFTALPAGTRFRPARATPKPRIAGVQPARVTAEEVAHDAPPPELNNDEFGRVRLRFAWDQREDDGTASSKWIRVSQHWAGPGFGAMYVPRVGHEVLVAFEEGDPDRPVIVGRAYNAQNPPPYMKPNTTFSTLKSDSVGEDGTSADGFNELRFDDAASEEQILLHAQRNLDEVVRADHSTSVGGNQTNSVGVDQANTVGGDRNHRVAGSELVHVEGPRTTELGATETHAVASHRVTAVGGNDTLSVVSEHSVGVGTNQLIDVSGNRTIKVGSNQNVQVGAVEIYKVGADRSLQITGHHAMQAGGICSSSASKHTFRSASTAFAESSDFNIVAGGAKLVLQGGLIHLDNGAGASITLAGGVIAVHADSVSDTADTLRASTSGATTQISAGAAMFLEAEGDLNAKGATIKLNG